jgi:hypothetical protein
MNTTNKNKTTKWKEAPTSTSTMTSRNTKKKLQERHHQGKTKQH